MIEIRITGNFTKGCIVAILNQEGILEYDFITDPKEKIIYKIPKHLCGSNIEIRARGPSKIPYIGWINLYPDIDIYGHTCILQDDLLLEGGRKWEMD